jgi:hypothetical protein
VAELTEEISEGIEVREGLFCLSIDLLAEEQHAIRRWRMTWSTTYGASSEVEEDFSIGGESVIVYLVTDFFWQSKEIEALLLVRSLLRWLQFLNLVISRLGAVRIRT